MKSKNPVFRPADALLIGAVLLIAGILFGHYSTRNNGTTAWIERDGKTLYMVPLSRQQEPLYYSVDGEYPLKICCENGTIYFSEASCPDQLCVRSGHLSKTGEMAACLPAGVVIRIVGEAEHDGVTG